MAPITVSVTTVLRGRMRDAVRITAAAGVDGGLGGQLVKGGRTANRVKNRH